MYSTNIPLKWRFCGKSCHKCRTPYNFPARVHENKPEVVTLSYRCRKCQTQWNYNWDKATASQHSSACLYDVLAAGLDQFAPGRDVAVYNKDLQCDLIYASELYEGCVEIVVPKDHTTDMTGAIKVATEIAPKVSLIRVMEQSNNGTHSSIYYKRTGSDWTAYEFGGRK